MTVPFISIVMRSFNEAWALKETLPALAAQDCPDVELIVIDSGSTDGSQDLIRAAGPAHFIQITPQEYNPSRVMNHGMRLARAERVLFLNADATPQGGALAPSARRRPARRKSRRLLWASDSTARLPGRLRLRL